MGWKNWPSWLKGGIIGLIVGIIMLVLFFTFIGRYLPSAVADYVVFIFYFPLLGVFFTGTGGTIGIIFYFAQYFIIGAIIGFIVGKIKSRR